MKLVTLVLAAVAAVCGQHVDSHRLSVDLPPGWQMAHESLTPSLLDPHEVLSVGTYPLHFRAVGCNHMPSSALLDLGPTDALVTLQERHADTHFPPRPAHFGPHPHDGSEAPECVPSARFTDHWFTFSDNGRNFHVLVAFGPRASAKTQREAWELLDELKVR